MTNWRQIFGWRIIPTSPIKIGPGERVKVNLNDYGDDDAAELDGLEGVVIKEETGNEGLWEVKLDALVNDTDSGIRVFWKNELKLI